jgi:SagB-type dehydrogenase family enzyme
MAGKTYPRFPQLALPKPEVSISLARAFAKRASVNTDMKASRITRAELSALCAGAMVRTEGGRAHPSGGARYPLELYVIVYSGEDIAPGAYHYRPDTHALEALWELEESIALPRVVFSDTQDLSHGTALLIISAVWGRSSSKYKRLAFELSLIEAGHLAQNILLAATDVAMAMRPVLAFNREELVRYLDMRATQEDPLYAVVVGR